MCSVSVRELVSLLSLLYGLHSLVGTGGREESVSDQAQIWDLHFIAEFQPRQPLILVKICHYPLPYETVLKAMKDLNRDRWLAWLKLRDRVLVPRFELGRWSFFPVTCSSSAV